MKEAYKKPTAWVHFIFSSEKNLACFTSKTTNDNVDYARDHEIR